MVASGQPFTVGMPHACGHGSALTRLLAQLLCSTHLLHRGCHCCLCCSVLLPNRSKHSFDMAAAWQGRCRKWYADRYDFRQNMVRVTVGTVPEWDKKLASAHAASCWRHVRLLFPLQTVCTVAMLCCCAALPCCCCCWHAHPGGLGLPHEAKSQGNTVSGQPRCWQHHSLLPFQVCVLWRAGLGAARVGCTAACAPSRSAGAEQDR